MAEVKIPTPAELEAIRDATATLFNALSEAGLVEEIPPPRLLEQALQQRRGFILYHLSNFEHSINPKRLTFPESPATGVSGWCDGLNIMQALVDLAEVRRFLLNHWGLQALASAISCSVGTASSECSFAPGHVHFEKSGDWPPAIPFECWNTAKQCCDTLTRSLEAEIRSPLLSPAKTDGGKAKLADMPPLTAEILKQARHEAFGLLELAASARSLARTFASDGGSIEREIREQFIELITLLRHAYVVVVPEQLPVRARTWETLRPLWELDGDLIIDAGESDRTAHDLVLHLAFLTLTDAGILLDPEERHDPWIWDAAMAKVARLPEIDQHKLDRILHREHDRGVGRLNHISPISSAPNTSRALSTGAPKRAVDAQGFCASEGIDESLGEMTKSSIESPAHSADFSSVRIGELSYTFTPTQRRIVQSLWMDWEKGTPWLSQAHLQESADTDSRIVDIFKDHPAFGTLITKHATVRDLFGLSLPVPTK